MNRPLSPRSRPAALMLGAALLILAAFPAAAQEEQGRRSILINPYFNLRVDWNSDTQGAGDPGNLAFRTILGSSLRFDFPGGMGLMTHYQGQLLSTRDGRLNTSVHTGTAMFSYLMKMTGYVDTVMPYGAVQVQYRVPTGALAGTSRFDTDFFAGVQLQHAPTRESTLYLGAQLDYFGASDTTQNTYGPALFIGYRQVLGSLALIGVSDRAQYRLENNFGRAARWRNDMTFEVWYFPWPWLMLNPSAGLQYTSPGDTLTWTTGVSVSTNLWFERSTPAGPENTSPSRYIDYRNDPRQIQLDTTLVPPVFGLPGGDLTVPADR